MSEEQETKYLRLTQVHFLLLPFAPLHEWLKRIEYVVSPLYQQTDLPNYD